MEPPAIPNTVFFPTRELASTVGVSVSALSHAVRENHRVRSLYPVAEWAVRDDAGRVMGFDVPEEVADFLTATAQSGRREASTNQPMSAQQAPVEAYIPRSDADYERQARHFNDLLSRANTEIDMLRAELRRKDDALEAERAARRQAVDDLRDQRAQDQDRWAQERMEFRDEIATLRVELKAYEAGQPPDADESEDEEDTTLQMLTQYGFPILDRLSQAFANRGAAPSTANPDAAPAVGPPSLQPEQQEALALVKVDPTRALDAQSALEAQVMTHLKKLVDAFRSGDRTSAVDAARALQAFPAELNWPHVAYALTATLRTLDPQGAVVWSWVKPLLSDLYPAALSMPAEGLASMAANLLPQPELRDWLQKVVLRGLESNAPAPSVPPQTRVKRKKPSASQASAPGAIADTDND